MFFHSILGDIDLQQTNGAVAAGTGDTQQFGEVNLADKFDAVLHFLSLGAVTATAVGTFRVRGAATTGGEGSSGTINCFTDPETGSIVSSYCFTGDSNLEMAVDIVRPGVNVFQKAELVRATANIAILSVGALLYNSHVAPSVKTGFSSHNTTGPGYSGAANVGLSAT